MKEYKIHTNSLPDTVNAAANKCKTIYEATLNTPEAFPPGSVGKKGISNWHPEYLKARENLADTLAAASLLSNQSKDVIVI